MVGEGKISETVSNARQLGVSGRQTLLAGGGACMRMHASTCFRIPALGVSFIVA
jgi:hypothetical protein